MKTLALAVCIVVVCLPALAQAPQPEEVKLAAEDLARRGSIAPDQITLARVAEATWPDTSLGCPQPDTAYAQVQVPGYLILLQAGGQQFEYHSDRKGRVVYCGRNIVQPDQVPPIVERARADLAHRLNCDQTEIVLVEAPYVEFANLELGTPNPPNVYPQRDILRPGYRPVFVCRDRAYEYRTGLTENVSFVRETEPGLPEAFRIAYLQRAANPDGHNVWDLALRNSVTGVVDIPVHNAVDFAVDPASGRAIFTRRLGTNRMVLAEASRPNVILAQASDIRGLGWDPSGNYVAWVRELPRGTWRLEVAEPGKEPAIVSIPADQFRNAVPGPLSWQGNLAAFDLPETPARTRSLLMQWPGGQVSTLPGRFAGWLDTPNRYLRFDDEGMLYEGDVTEGAPARKIASLPDLTWARPLPGCRAYIALTQEGDLLRVWQGPMDGLAAPKLLTELTGALIQAQLAQRGTLLMVQQVEKRSDRRGECKVTLVNLATGSQEPLSGVCVHAQLLPMR